MHLKIFWKTVSVLFPTTMSYHEQSCQNDSVGYEENIIMRHVIIIMIVLILKHKIEFTL